MTHAAEVTDSLDRPVTRDDLDELRRELTEQLTDRLSSLWRRDLLLIITGQFVALAGVLTAIT